MAPGNGREKSRSYSFEWKIRDCFKTETTMNNRYESPTFELCDATWYFKICHRGSSCKFIRVYLIKKNSFVKDHVLFYELRVMSRDGTTYVTAKAKQEFTSFICVSAPSMLLGTKDGFMQQSKNILRDGVLTIYCNVKCDPSPQPSSMIVGEIPDKLQQDFKDLLISEEDSDVVVRVKDQEFKAHKVILRARSPVFKAMFSCDMVEAKSGIVEITDCDPGAFRYFLSFLYSGRMEEVSADKVFDLYRIADKYGVQNLKDECFVFIVENISMKYFCEVMTLAVQYNDPVLKEKATCFFKRNDIQIIATANWLAFMREYPDEANELFMEDVKSFKKAKY